MNAQYGKVHRIKHYQVLCFVLWFLQSVLITSSTLCPGKEASSKGLQGKCCYLTWGSCTCVVYLQIYLFLVWSVFIYCSSVHFCTSLYFLAICLSIHLPTYLFKKNHENDGAASCEPIYIVVTMTLHSLKWLLQLELDQASARSSASHLSHVNVGAQILGPTPTASQAH